MKKVLFILGIILGTASFVNAQVTTAQDFTMSDCASNTQNLYTHLNNEEVVIMEFFMTCGSCLTAGQRITAMMPAMNAEHPGMVNFWALAYTNSYTCSTVNNWITTNSITAVPFDSGAAQVAYYGGFGMPTVVVVAGSQHQVIYNSNTDGAPGDTAAIHAAIDNFFATMGVENSASNVKVSLYPNPTSNILNVDITMLTESMVNIQMVDLTGKVVKEISNSVLPLGSSSMQLETSDLSNGIYFLRVNSGGKSSQYKISIKH